MILSVKGITLRMFIHSDFVPHWTLIVPCIWTVIIVHGSLQYLDSDLWRIPSLTWVVYLWLCNCNRCNVCSHACCYDLSVIACDLIFCSSWPWMECQRACLIRIQGFKYCMIGTANGPSCIVKEDIDIIRGQEMHNICPRTWCMRSSIAFTCGFFTMVGLCFLPYESHRCSKCNLN